MTELNKAIYNLKSELFKARIKKYIKKIPKPGGGFKYIYKETKKKEKEIEKDEKGYINEGFSGGWRTYKVKNGIMHFGSQGQDQLKQDIPDVKYPYFFRATNNTKESELGDFRSINAITGQKEKGVSVSPHPKYAIFNNLKHLYAVTGDVVGHGSDGEPLLKNIKYIKKLNINKAEKEYDLNRYEIIVKFLKEKGMKNKFKIDNLIKNVFGEHFLPKYINNQ